MPPESPISGIFQCDQARILKDAGFKVGVISPNLKSLRFIPNRKAWSRFGYNFDDSDGIPAYSFDGWNWSIRRYRIIGWRWIRKGIRLFKKYIKDEGVPDIIHCHNALFAGMLARRIKTEFDIPYILTEHSSAYALGYYPTFFYREISKIYKNADCLLVVSPRLGELLESIFGKTTLDWQWVPNIVDSRFEDQPIPIKSTDKERETFSILSIGNLDQNKNHEDLIRAFVEKFKGANNVRLRIGGEGPLLNHLIRVTHERGVEDQVIFLGYIDRAEVLREMDTCDFMVLSSRYETFGVVLIEALSRGKPIIATACGGPECIVNKGNGILTPKNDSMILGNAMKQMFETIGNYDPHQIRKDALAIFGKKAVISQLLRVYEEAMKNSGAST